MIGIILKDLTSSQINYDIFTQLNKDHSKYNGLVFLKNLTQSFIQPSFPIINYTKIFSSHLNEKDIIIATDLDSAEALSNTKNRCKKIFYVWELEFLRSQNFERNTHIYNSLPIITRSKSYQEALNNYANIDVKVGELNLYKIWKTNNE